MAAYRFGPRGMHAAFHVDAPSLKRAIAMFRVGVLYPHSYTTDPVPASSAKKSTLHWRASQGPRFQCTNFRIGMSLSR